MGIGGRPRNSYGLVMLEHEWWRSRYRRSRYIIGFGVGVGTDWLSGAGSWDDSDLIIVTIFEYLRYRLESRYDISKRRNRPLIRTHPAYDSWRFLRKRSNRVCTMTL